MISDPMAIGITNKFLNIINLIKNNEQNNNYSLARTGMDSG